MTNADFGTIISAYGSSLPRMINPQLSVKYCVSCAKPPPRPERASHRFTQPSTRHLVDDCTLDGRLYGIGLKRVLVEYEEV